jgi:hypothetical protein
MRRFCSPLGVSQGLADEISSNPESLRRIAAVHLEIVGEPQIPWNDPPLFHYVRPTPAALILARSMANPLPSPRVTSGLYGLFRYRYAAPQGADADR